MESSPTYLYFYLESKPVKSWYMLPIIFTSSFSCGRVREPSDSSGKRLRSMHRRSSTDTGLDAPVSRQILKGLETTGIKSSRDATGVSSGTIPLMETGGLNWFVGMHIFSS